MVLIARNRILEKYTKANYLYHQGKIIAKVIKEYLKSEQYLSSLVFHFQMSYGAVQCTHMYSKNFKNLGEQWYLNLNNYL